MIVVNNLFMSSGQFNLNKQPEPTSVSVLPDQEHKTKKVLLLMQK